LEPLVSEKPVLALEGLSLSLSLPVPARLLELLRGFSVLRAFFNEDMAAVLLRRGGVSL
jgi:hypothetical protein